MAKRVLAFLQLFIEKAPMILNALKVSVLLFRVPKDGKCIKEDMK
jgi:hypothetical protein